MFTTNVLFSLGQFLLPFAIAGISAFLLAALNSDAVKSYVAVHTQKLAAEAANLVADAMHTNNLLLGMMVRAAMAYAEQHEAAILTTYKSKADYVVAIVAADPRFAAMAVPLSVVENLIEDLWESIYQDVSQVH